MGMKVECPACKSWTSYVYDALHGEREACANCGLPGSVMREIAKVQESHASAEVKQQADAALLRAGKAEAENAKLKAQLAAAQRMARRIADGYLDDRDDD